LEPQELHELIEGIVDFIIQYPKQF